MSALLQSSPTLTVRHATTLSSSWQYVLDHPPLLEDALTTAKHRVLIISPWIRAEVVDQQFLRRLEALLKNGIRVYIGYGIAEETKKDLPPRDIAAVNNLRLLTQRYQHLRLERLGNTHAKVLIKDADFAAVTSFNWLSFKGDANKKFRDEQGTLLQTPELVNRKFEELIVRFAPGDISGVLATT